MSRRAGANDKGKHTQSAGAVIARLIERGDEPIILGCFEILLLVEPEGAAVQLVDTTAIHADAAADRALSLPHQAA